MSKPEDISQDVWDKAKEIVFTPYLMEWEGIAAVSYAIMAAKNEERKACALIASNMSNPYKDGARGVAGEHGKAIADAILQGGEA